MGRVAQEVRPRSEQAPRERWIVKVGHTLRAGQRPSPAAPRPTTETAVRWASQTAHRSGPVTGREAGRATRVGAPPPPASGGVG